MDTHLTKQWVNEGAESLLGIETTVLDKGFVALRAYQGIDETIVAAARVSYGRRVDLDAKEKNAKLINYLMRNRHTSPFEMCSLTFELKVPIFIARELVRHRTASLSEISARYAELPEEYYVPSNERIQSQSSSNKQCSGSACDQALQRRFIQGVEEVSKAQFEEYHHSLNNGVARELSRVILPLNTYTRMYWSMDLHNLFHFLKLRLPVGAQWEFRQYASRIASVVQNAFPISWAAFEEHVLNSVTLSASEVAALSKFFCERHPATQFDCPTLNNILGKLSA